jgi:hypothetical protein
MPRLPPHPLWLLLAACGAVDLDTVFFDGVEAERSYDYDLGREVLDVASTGLPHHKFDVSFEPGVPIKFSTTLPLPEDYVQRGVAFGGRPLPDGPIGVAVNGVAIYAYDTNLTKRDGCFGHKIDGAYVYVEAFPCLFGDDRNHYHTVREAAYIGFGTSIRPDGTAAADPRSRHFRSGVIGVMNDGFPLFGPLDEHGNVHQGLDECGGRYNEDGEYAYYASLAPPYTIACFGPGYEATPPSPIKDAVPRVTNNDAEPACPAGSIATSKGCTLCQAGRYAKDDGCHGTCPAGHYCLEGSTGPEAAVECPGGVFGDVRGLRDAKCAGPCPPGSFCPRGSLKPRPCGSEDRYCPAGSSAPVLADAGAYTTPQMASAWAPAAPYYVDDGSEAPYCMASEGANCTAAAIASRPLAPRQTGIQQCEPGHFCTQGIKFRCPGGRYGSEHELKTPNCTAACPAGTYCPEGSLEPSLLPAGRYSPKKELRSWNQASLCPAGSYCPPGAAAPSQCPAGRFGDRVGLKSAACPAKESDGDAPSRCPAGYVCPSGTAVPTSTKCGSPRALDLLEALERNAPLPERGETLRGGGLGAAAFCPRGSASIKRVRRGYYSIGPATKPRSSSEDADVDVRSDEVLCEAGHYCVQGIRHPCPAGRFGASSGLDNARCSGPCAPGYYCPTGSSSKNEHACGGPEVYCPVGSPEPLHVGEGNYSSVDIDEYENEDGTLVPASTNMASTVAADARASQRICEPGYFCEGGVRRPCPAGHYGSDRGLSARTCNGKCPPGMWCAERSTAALPTRNGSYCATGGCTTEEGDGPCEPGYYCPRGSSSSTQRPCCDARRDDFTGLWYTFNGRGFGTSNDVDVILLVDNEAEWGHSYHPPPGEVYDYDGFHQHAPARLARTCETLFCPRGSAAPRNVSEGYYSVGGNRTTRHGQAKCDGLENRRQTHRIGLDRAPYCATTVQGGSHAPGVDDETYGQGTADGLHDSARAWQPPLFLGLKGKAHIVGRDQTEYEWAPLPEDAPSEACCTCLQAGAFNLCHECQGVCRTACDVEAATCASLFPRLLIDVAS